MVEELLHELELLLTREREILHKFSLPDPGEEGDSTLQQLSQSLEQCGVLLARLGETGPGSLDQTALRHLQELKCRREDNRNLLSEILHSSGKKIADLQVEKKALCSYFPAASAGARFLDWEG